jgi:hypothetical protein
MVWIQSNLWIRRFQRSCLADKPEWIERRWIGHYPGGQNAAAGAQRVEKLKMGRLRSNSSEKRPVSHFFVTSCGTRPFRIECRSLNLVKWNMEEKSWWNAGKDGWQLGQ